MVIYSKILMTILWAIITIYFCIRYNIMLFANFSTMIIAIYSDKM